MTEKIKKLEQLVRIKDSKIEVGRILRLSRVIVLDDPGWKNRQAWSPQHALGGCVQTWSLKEVDVKAKHWNYWNNAAWSFHKWRCHDVYVHFALRYGSRRRVWPHDKVWKWRDSVREHKIGVPLSKFQQCPRPRAAGFTTVGWKRTHERNISKFDHISTVNSVQLSNKNGHLGEVSPAWAASSRCCNIQPERKQDIMISA